MIYLVISLAASVVFLIAGLIVTALTRHKDNPDKARVYVLSGGSAYPYRGRRVRDGGDSVSGTKTELYRYKVGGKVEDVVVSGAAAVVFDRGRRLLAVRDGVLVGDSFAPEHPQPVSREAVMVLTQTDVVARYARSVSRMSIGSNTPWAIILVVAGAALVGFLVWKFALSGPAAPGPVPGEVERKALGLLLSLVGVA